MYWGESGLSACQHHKNHEDEVERGDMSNPLVQHSIEVHRGKKTSFCTMIKSIESRPLYRAVREAVLIAQMPQGHQNLNRCQEWGMPHIPVLTVIGGGHACSGA